MKNIKNIVLPINIGIALGYFGNYIYMPHLISIIGQKYSGTLAGFLIFLTFLGRLLASVVAGGISEKFGRKRVLVSMILVEAFALLSYGFSNNIFILTLIATIVGIASGLHFPGIKATLAELPKEDRPKAFSHFILAQKIGMMGGALVGMFFTIVDIQILFSLVFFIFVGYAVVVGFFLHLETPNKIHRKVAIVNWKNPREWEIWKIFGLFISYTLFWFFYSQFLVGIPLHISWLAKSVPVTLPFWITGLTMLTTQGYVYKTASRALKENQLLAAGMLSLFLSFLFLGTGKTLVWIVLASILFVIGEILFSPAFDVWLSNNAADDIDRAMGTQHFFRSFGNMLGTSSAGMAYDLARFLDFPGLNWIIFSVLAFVCSWYLLKKRQRVKSLALEVCFVNSR